MRVSSQMTMRIVAALLLALLVAPSTAQVNCELCGEGVELKWPLSVLKSDGTKCTDIALAIGNYDPWSEECERNRYWWRNPCCGPNKPVDVAITPTRPPTVQGQGQGPHPVCHLCIGGGFPANDNMVISLLYVGTGDCQMFYDDGLRGNIQGHMCDPLRYFAYEPCGCGQAGQAPPVDPPPNPAPAPAPNPNGPAYPSRKDYNPADDKAGFKLSNQRGGAGGKYIGVRRALKGSRSRSATN